MMSYHVHDENMKEQKVDEQKPTNELVSKEDFPNPPPGQSIRLPQTLELFDDSL